MIDLRLQMKLKVFRGLVHKFEYMMTYYPDESLPIYNACVPVGKVLKILLKLIGI